MREYELLIDGKMVPASNGATLATVNAAGEPVSLVARSAARDARRALDAARRAADAGIWRNLAHDDRRRLLVAVADSLFERQAELADLETAEAGIPVRIASELISAAIDRFRIAVERERAGARPFGVVALMPALDAPFARTAEAIGAALASGNTVVVNAGLASPSSGLELARAIWESDLPPGVVNVVSGGADTDEELAGNPLADAVSYAGDTVSARRIAEIVAPSLRPATIEAGRAATAIVLPDADLDLAVPGVLFGAMFLSGRTFRPLSRLLVHASIAEPFVHHLVRGATALRTGDPVSFATDLGPLAGERSLNATQDIIRQALGEGAEAVCGGVRLHGPGPYLAPTILHKVTPAMHVMSREFNAPVLTVAVFSTKEEAISLANESSGDAALWSRDVEAAAKVSGALRAQRVWANDYDPLTSANVDVSRMPVIHTASAARARQALIGLDSVYGFDATPYA